VDWGLLLFETELEVFPFPQGGVAPWTIHHPGEAKEATFQESFGDL